MKNLSIFFMWDVRNGLVRMWPGLLGAFAFFSFFFFVLTIRVQANTDGSSVLSFVDYVVCFIAGIPTYVFDPSNPFKLPAQWLLLYLFISYATLHYPCRDLSGMGMHIIVASGNRKQWWLGKCIWISVCVVVFFVVGILTAILWGFISGGGLGLEVSKQALTALGFTEPAQSPLFWSIVSIVFVAMFAMMAICYVQMAVAILTKPLIGFIITVSILFLSAFIQSPFLVGNYLMAARSNVFVLGGLSEWQGIICAFAVSTAAITIGKIYFENMDIVGNGDKL